VFLVTYKTTAHFQHSYNVACFPSEKKGNYINYTFLLHDWKKLQNLTLYINMMPSVVWKLCYLAWK